MSRSPAQTNRALRNAFLQRDQFKARLDECVSHNETLRAERDEAKAKVDEVAKFATDLLMGGCDRHGDMTLPEFAEAGGGGCPVCLKRERDEARAQQGPLIDALVRIKLLCFDEGATVARAKDIAAEALAGLEEE